MLIGLHGKLASGKDTVYERAQTLGLGAKVERLSFADKLKDSAATLLGIDRETMEKLKRQETFNSITVWTGGEGDEDTFIELSMRTFLQRYGTEAHRDIFGQNFWVDALLPPLHGAALRAWQNTHKDSLVLVTDVRFPNEAKRVREYGGSILQVLGVEPPCTCDGPRDYLDTEPRCVLHDTHASETVLPDDLIDGKIDNTRRDDDFEWLDRQLAAQFGGFVPT